MLQGVSSAGIAGYTRLNSRPNLGVGSQALVDRDRFEMTASPALMFQERPTLSRSEVLGKLKSLSSVPDQALQAEPPCQARPAAEQLGWLLAGQTW